MAGQLMYLSEAPSASEIELFGDQPDVLNIGQVASLLGVASATIRREIDRGNLGAVHVGRCVRVTKTALLEYLGEVENDQ